MQDSGNTVTKPSDPTRAGYGFNGWYSDEDLETEYDFRTEVTKDITLYAKWAATNYAITYDLDGGIVALGNPGTYSIESADITLTNPTKEGYTFAGWTGTGLTEATQKVTITKGSTGNRSYTATWTEKVTITFNSNGGSNVASVMQDSGNTVTKPSDPTRAGYGFGGWYSDEDLETEYEFDTEVTKDITLYAKWTATNYTITYDLDGGTVATANPTTYTIESADITLTNPTREGYGFAGWTGTDLTEATQKVTIAKGSTGNKSYRATWTERVTITFNTNGGSNVASVTQDSGNTVTKPADPTRTGYGFDGWYSDEDLGTEYDFSTEVTRDITLYAKWTATNYTITYDLDGGTVATANPGTYTIESDDITLTNPTREGYSFAGWTGTDLTEATQKVTIGKGSIGNRTYTATYEKEDNDDQVKAKEVTDQINALPASAKVSDKDQIQAAREAFDGLTEAQKSFITDLEALEDKLTAAERQMAEDADISKKTFTLSETEYAFTGEEIRPSVTSADGLKIDQDFTVAYSSNTNPGDRAKVTVTGAGDYSGSQEVFFKINKGTGTLSLSMSGGKKVASGKYKLGIGDEGKVKAAIDHNYGENVVDTDVTFKSSDETIAAIAEDGTVTAYKGGEVTITVTVTSNQVNVEDASLSLTIEKGTPVIAVPALSITHYLTDGNTVELGAQIDDDLALTYTSSDPQIAQVDDQGKVTVSEAGEASITISSKETDLYYAADPVEIHINVKKMRTQKTTIKLNQKTVNLGYGSMADATYDVKDLFTITPELESGDTKRNLVITFKNPEQSSYVEYDESSKKLIGKKYFDDAIEMTAYVESEDEYIATSDTVDFKVKLYGPYVKNEDTGKEYISLSSALGDLYSSVGPNRTANLLLLQDTLNSEILHNTSDLAVIKEGFIVTLNLNGHKYNSTLKIYGKLILKNTQVYTVTAQVRSFADEAEEDSGTLVDSGSFKLCGGTGVLEFADGFDDDKINEIADAVTGDSAKIENTEEGKTTFYASLDVAVEEAGKEAEEASSEAVTVVLTKDTSITNEIELKENVKIDLNGNSLCAENEDAKLTGTGTIGDSSQESGSQTIIPARLVADTVKTEETVEVVELPVFTAEGEDIHTYDGKSPVIGAKAGTQSIPEEGLVLEGHTYTVQPKPGYAYASEGARSYYADIYQDGQKVDTVAKQVIVTPREITADDLEYSVTASRKYEEGNTAAVLETFAVKDTALKSLLEKDNISLIPVAEYADENVGTDKDVTISVSLESNDEIHSAESMEALENYKLTATSLPAKATITAAPFPDNSIKVSAYSGDYDGTKHTIKVQAPEGANVTYQGEGQTGYSAVNPGYMDVGNYTVSYRVQKDNYESVEGESTVSISACKIAAPASIKNRTVRYNGKKQSLDIQEIEGAVSSVTYTLDGKNTNPIEVGEYTVTVTYETDDNHIFTDGKNEVTITGKLSIVSSEEETETEKSAQAVIKLVNAFNTDKVTVDGLEAFEKQVSEAKKALEEITSEQRASLSEELAQQLAQSEEMIKAAEDKIVSLKADKAKADNQKSADAVTKLLDALKGTDSTAEDEAAVAAARKAYDALTPEQKELVSAEALKKLIDSETQIKTLKEAKESQAKQNPAVSLAALDSPLCLAKGASKTVTVFVTAKDNSVITTDKVTVNSSKTKIAKVDKVKLVKGKLTFRVKGIKAGSSKVVVKAGKTSVTVKVTVAKKKNAAKSLKAAKKKVTVKVGKTAKIKVKITARDKKSATTDVIKATSSKKAVTSVSNIAVAKGKATITVKGLKKGSSVLTIKAGKKKVKVRVTAK
jgi:uncharacterized repeat protein (TIGR02543 family)